MYPIYGIVGFSKVIEKIILSIDTELINSYRSEEYFCDIWKNTLSTKTINSNPTKAENAIKRLIGKLHFENNINTSEISRLLLEKNLISY